MPGSKNPKELKNVRLKKKKFAHQKKFFLCFKIIFNPFPSYFEDKTGFLHLCGAENYLWIFQFFWIFQSDRIVFGTQIGIFTLQKSEKNRENPKNVKSKKNDPPQKEFFCGTGTLFFRGNLLLNVLVYWRETLLKKMRFAFFLFFFCTRWNDFHFFKGRIFLMWKSEKEFLL